MKRAALVTLIGLCVLLGSATPAEADPAGPSNFESAVTAAPTTGLTVTVLGGDAFLQLTALDGAVIVLPGYSGEPYLRFNKDGTVDRNLRSPATYLNEDRYQNVAVPATASVEADPAWERVSDSPTYLFHDHRTHWMLPRDPGQGDFLEPGSDVVSEWSVDLTIDGQPAAIQGELRYLGPVSPLPSIVLAGAIIAILVFGVATRSQLRWLAAAMVGGSVCALVIGVAERAALPQPATPSVLIVILPALAMLCSCVALFLAPSYRGMTLLASAAVLGGWCLLRLDAFTAARLPSDLPDGLERVMLTIAAGVAVSTAIVVVRAGAVGTTPAPSPVDQ